MTVPFITAALLAVGTTLAPGTLTPPASVGTVQTLSIRTHEGGSLLLDGAPCSDTTLVLRDAHIATIADEDAYTVALPDGRIFYKGDLQITVQSRETGTVSFEIENGEASLESRPAK